MLMLFKDRRKLEQEFREWAREKGAAESLFNAITWLVCIKGYELPEKRRADDEIAGGDQAGH